MRAVKTNLVVPVLDGVVRAGRDRDDDYEHDLLTVATLMRAYRPTMNGEQWRTWLRFLAARGDDAKLPFELVRQ